MKHSTTPCKEPYMRMAEKRIPDIKFASDFELLPADLVKTALLDTVRRGYAMGYRHGVSRRWKKAAKKFRSKPFANKGEKNG